MDKVAAPRGTAADERYPLDRTPRPRRSQALAPSPSPRGGLMIRRR